uniref:Uncharacterized protein n=1 Tax=Arundo donax TaxID=35708 RepID=A0A0A9BN69_ARUDO
MHATSVVPGDGSVAAIDASRAKANVGDPLACTTAGGERSSPVA